jgi:hypothetical protein
MLFNNTNQPIGTIRNPIIKSLFTQQFEQGGFPIPPETNFRITDSGNFRITDNDNNRITDV